MSLLLLVYSHFVCLFYTPFLFLATRAGDDDDDDIFYFFFRRARSREKSETGWTDDEMESISVSLFLSVFLNKNEGPREDNSRA